MKRWLLPVLALGLLLSLTSAGSAQPKDTLTVALVSHAPTLIDALHQQPTCHAIMLDKRFGETHISNKLDVPRKWQWPSR